MSGLEGPSEDAEAMKREKVEVADGSSKEPDIVDLVLGGGADEQTVVSTPVLRANFAPWHHPIKQIVRDYQWSDQVKRLFRNYRTEEQWGILRYFTLPGADLLDVRMLVDSLSEFNTKIEYFGFDTGYSDEEKQNPINESGTYLAAESALRQADKITDKAEILRDRLEDIAVESSHAAARLGQHDFFDVINIDACSHLGYKAPGREASIFDALEALLAHQMKATKTWLLFITTRANTEVLGEPVEKLKTAIAENIALHGKFAEALGECLGGTASSIEEDMLAHWSSQSREFLKLFCVGLGKYLLQYYHSQPNLPAAVEMVSAFAYKIKNEEPDMLSLAFRIKPTGLQVQPAKASGPNQLPAIELSQATNVVSKASRLWDLDAAIANDAEVRNDAIAGTKKLLSSANYDIECWETWLKNLPVRPMHLNDVV